MSKPRYRVTIEPLDPDGRPTGSHSAILSSTSPQEVRLGDGWEIRALRLEVKTGGPNSIIHSLVVDES